jgi:hypothetical protein
MPGMARMARPPNLPQSPALRPRGPKGTPQVEKPPRPFPDPPTGWPGSLPEWAIYFAHRQIGLPDDPTPGIWTYQGTLGGGYNLGGLILDFIEEDVRTGIQVQGEYWHYQKGSVIQRRDQMTRSIIAAFGLNPIFIDEDDALTRPGEILRLARTGIDLSKSARAGGY